MLQGIGGHLEVAEAVLALALAEGQRDGHLACGTDAVAPEGGGRNLDRREGYLGVRIAVAGRLLCLECPGKSTQERKE